MSENGDIYTAGKNFTLPLALTAWTNSTSLALYAWFLWGISNPHHIFLVYSARAQRARGLLLVGGTLIVGWGKTFWCVIWVFFFFYENRLNSGPKSRRLDLWVSKFYSGLTGFLCRKTGFLMKKRLSSQNPKFWAPKNTLLNRNHVLATTGQSWQRKWYPFPK